jgi:hypothetical protein
MEKTVFKKGDRVFHIEYGWGEVTCAEIPNSQYPVVVFFDSQQEISFTTNGTELSFSLQPMLSFTEYTLQGFSQERPIELPEVKECVMVSNNKVNWVLRFFLYYKTDSEYPFVTEGSDSPESAWKNLIRIKHNA